jgi:hypothetical protein
MAESATPRDDRQGGFAAVDALVAPTILATALILCFRAVETARQAANRASEIVRATQMLRGLLDASPKKPGVTSGESSGFFWRSETEPLTTDAERTRVQLCERKARVTNIISRRQYGFATSFVCLTAP